MLYCVVSLLQMFSIYWRSNLRTGSISRRRLVCVQEDLTRILHFEAIILAKLMRQVSNLLPEGRGDLSKRDRRPPQSSRRLDKWPARNFSQPGRVRSDKQFLC